MSNKKESRADLDWENRTLCSDESCIGVIGPDGRCKECGRPYEGFEYKTTDTEEFDTPAESEPETEDAATTEVDSDWENRTLCVDESCIGVIGPDGRCKECGLPFKKNG